MMIVSRAMVYIGHHVFHKIQANSWNSSLSSLSPVSTGRAIDVMEQTRQASLSFEVGNGEFQAKQ